MDWLLGSSSLRSNLDWFKPIFNFVAKSRTLYAPITILFGVKNEACPFTWPKKVFSSLTPWKRPCFVSLFMYNSQRWEAITYKEGTKLAIFLDWLPRNQGFMNSPHKLYEASLPQWSNYHQVFKLLSEV